MELAGVIISALIVLFAAWLKWYTGRDTTYADLQTGRVDIMGGNVDGVSTRIDKLLVPETADSSGNAGSAGNISDTGSASTLDRLSAIGISVDNTVRESGKGV